MPQDSEHSHLDLAHQLAAAWQSHSVIGAPEGPHLPTEADTAAAFDIQHQTLEILKQPIAGWKIGAKSLDGPIQGAPLPASCLLGSGAVVQLAHYAVVGLELEIAFRFGRVFEPSGGPYPEEEVLASLQECMPAIEIVSSRYTGWPAVDKLAQLADLQNHGALVVGTAVPYDAALPFLEPRASFAHNGESLVQESIGNPAGDPRRLLTWVVNHCAARGISIGPDVVVTTGSYTGMCMSPKAGVVTGRIAGFPPIELTLE